MKNSVDVVLAIYKPNHYLIEQLDSLVNQTYYNYINRIIIVNDSPELDGDIYRKIISYDKVSYNVNNSGSHGAKENFTYALSLSNAMYIMTCDQDDVWKEDKIEVSIERLISFENSSTDKTPCLVATDVEVVDSNLTVINDSFQSFRGTTQEKYKKHSNLLVRNIYPGCTMAFNRALLEKALPVPKSAIMHDWWLLSVSLLTGEVGFVNQSTMLYRQHGNNTLGAHKSSPLKSLFNRSLTSNIALADKQLKEIFAQLRELDSNFTLEPYFDSRLLLKPTKLKLVKFLLLNYPYPIHKKLAIICSVILSK
ncbi:glycosyltransferase [Vibrio lentus]|uniref:Glycosyltransferase 2-like domain-containing protein n=1 Tax=Vibrio lentus TaxID=136468 RepID=A0AB36XM10_9VIBR|nr:glycosyltransferase [Vibrio lentus]MCC4837791.1 glycosyltransferase [Vibrio lentus]MDH5929504.1 glycosyltransferase [Vibrio lentus]PMI15670.1 hypothetical protein BCU51_17055 [Vibrio lentus]PMK31417.1 hypothetical protein BCU02_02050 [Vibrio lentus]PMK46309.1 hypothetical protein BCT99_20210 [Vibrio lentus]